MIKYSRGVIVKTITIKQSFATLIALGLKQYEFRTWKTSYRGDLLIHAGKGVDKKAMARFKDLNYSYPTGCILAKVTLTDCIPINEKTRNMLQEKNSFIYHSVIKDREWQGYGWHLENVQKIKPIDANGKLSFWEYEGEIEWNEK